MASDCLDTNSAPGSSARTHPRLLFSVVGDGILLGTCILLLSAQLFVRPFIGMADNGDFSKVTGRASLAPKFQVANFSYVVPVYIRSHKYRWSSEFLTSETLLAALASNLEKLTGPADVFDIRYMGIVHATAFFLAFLILLMGLRRWSPVLRFSTGAFVLFVFSDVMYTGYYNSFYSDTVAFLCLMWMVVLALLFASRDDRTWLWFLFSVAALVFVTSKAQHALAAWIPAAFLLWVAWRAPKRRLIGAGLAILIVIAGIVQLRSTPSWVQGMTAFDVVFHQIVLSSADPAADLNELGLSTAYSQYVGQHAFMKDSPAGSPAWASQFHHEVTHGAIARFYVLHPLRTLHILGRNLKQNAVHLRPIGNFCLGDGHPPNAISHQYAIWSDLRTRLLAAWPGSIVLWYGIFLVGAATCLRGARDVSERNVAGIAVGVSLLGIYEFGVATLADAVETGRHLFLFHACTDVTICFAVTAMMLWIKKIFDSQSS